MATRYTKRKRRSNADDALRNAERAYRNDPSKENIANYWKACLRAGLLPEATYVWPDGKDRVWTLDPKRYSNHKTRALTKRIVLEWSYDWLNGAPSPQTLHFLVHVGMTKLGPFKTMAEAEEVVKKELMTLIETGKARRIRKKNGDDLLRKLERKAFETYDKEDIANYWRACLRAGEIPKPTMYGILKLLDTSGHTGWKRADHMLPEDYEGIVSDGWSLYKNCLIRYGSDNMLPRVAVHKEYNHIYYWDETRPQEVRQGSRSYSPETLKQCLRMLLERY